MVTEKKERYVVGIDLGTGSCKTVIMHLPGQILGEGVYEYPMESMHGKWEEQNPDDLLRGAIQSVKKALKAARVSRNNCMAISLGGALHSLIALDRHDRPITSVMTWADNRAAAQVESLSQSLDMHQHYLRSGCPNHPMYPFAKIIYLKETQKDLFEQAAWFISAKEYLTLKMTGQHLVDYSVASGTGLLDIHKLVWDSTALTTAGIQPQQLSVLCHPNTCVELLDSEFSEELGLPPKTPVIIGSSDAVNSSLGAGVARQEQMTCMVGTSGAIRTITNHPILDHKERTWCYAVDHDHWLVGGAINNGGLALQWLQHALERGAGEKSGTLPPSIEDLLDWAEQVKPGADGVICLPFFTNERSPNWNPNARAVFYGLTIQHDQRHFARSILEGIGFRLLSVLEVLDDVVGKGNEVHASGGYTRSPFWLQLIANMLNRVVLVPKNNESSAVGAAFWALLGIGTIDRIETMADIVNIKTAYQPDGQVQDIYRQAYAVYLELYQQLRNLYDKTANNPQT